MVEWVIYFWVLKSTEGKKRYYHIVWVATAAADGWLNAECAKTQEECYTLSVFVVGVICINYTCNANVYISRFGYIVSAFVLVCRLWGCCY
jgi:hypothetical protein